MLTVVNERSKKNIYLCVFDYLEYIYIYIYI